MSLAEVRIPDMGEAKGVTVVDVLVKKGSEIRIDDALITLESDKASMDVPSPVSGVVESIELKKGDEVVAGALIAKVQVAEAGTPAVAPPAASPTQSASPALAPAATAAAPAPATAPARRVPHPSPSR